MAFGLCTSSATSMLDGAADRATPSKGGLRPPGNPLQDSRPHVAHVTSCAVLGFRPSGPVTPCKPVRSCSARTEDAPPELGPGMMATGLWTFVLCPCTRRSPERRSVAGTTQGPFGV